METYSDQKKAEEGQGDGDWNEVKRKRGGKQSMNRNSKGTTGSDNSSNSSLGDRNGNENENESVYFSLENSTSSETEKNDNERTNDNEDMLLDSLNNTYGGDDSNQEDEDENEEVLNASLIVNLSESRINTGNLNFQSFLSAPSTPLNSSRSAPPDLHDEEETNGKKRVTFSGDVTMQEIDSDVESDDHSQLNSSSVNVVDETFNDSAKDLEDGEIKDESPAQPPGRPLMSYADVIRNNNSKENGVDPQELMTQLEGKMNAHGLKSPVVIEDYDDDVIFLEEVKGSGVRNIPPRRNHRVLPNDDDELQIVYEGAGDRILNLTPIKQEKEAELSPMVQKFNLTGQLDSIDAADVEVERINERVDENEGLPSTVSVLETPNGIKIYLIGTAHFSLKSQNDVKETISKVNPKLVFLELCHSRKNILNMDEEEILKQASNLGVESYKAAARNGGYLQAALHMILLSMSATLTKKLGMAPGGEFRVAAREANKCPGCVVVLGDRPFQTTLRRAFRSLTIFQKGKLLYHFLTTNDDITPEEVEKCKERDMIEAMLAEMTGEFPGITKVFVDERDAYLAHTLYMAATDQKASTPVVAVVGMGHVAGMKKYFGNTSQEMISNLSSIPPVALSERILINCVKLGFYGLLGFGTYRMVKYTGVDKNIMANASTLSSRFLGSFAAFKTSFLRQ